MVGVMSGGCHVGWPPSRVAACRVAATSGGCMSGGCHVGWPPSRVAACRVAATSGGCMSGGRQVGWPHVGWLPGRVAALSGGRQATFSFHSPDLAIRVLVDDHVPSSANVNY
jgi:hypothetical protein